LCFYRVWDCFLISRSCVVRRPSVSNLITPINRYTFVSISYNYYSNDTMMVCTLRVRMFIIIIILNRVSLRCTQQTRRHRHTSSSSSVAPNTTSYIVSSGGANVIYSDTIICILSTCKRVHICTYLCGVLTFYPRFDFLI